MSRRRAAPAPVEMTAPTTKRSRGGSAPRVGRDPASERLELRLPPDIKERWEALAVARGLSMSELIRAAVEHFELCASVVDQNVERRASELEDLGREVLELVRVRFPRRRKE